MRKQCDSLNMSGDKANSLKFRYSLWQFIKPSQKFALQVQNAFAQFKREIKANSLKFSYRLWQFIKLIAKFT